MTTGSLGRTSSQGQERALVLGGGGSAGNAWLIGVVAGLFDAGLDVTDADWSSARRPDRRPRPRCRGDPAALLADILSAAPPQRTRPAGSDRGRGSVRPSGDHLERTGRSSPPRRIRPTCAAEWARRRSSCCGVGRLRAGAVARDRRCPAAQPGLAAANGARHGGRRPTGEPVVFDRHSGVDLVDAVAASTPAALAYRIGDGRYIDGGYRRNENADLAAGYERVLVLSPLGGRTRHPLEWGMQLAVQVDELRAGGSRVETVLPDDRLPQRVRHQPDGPVDPSAGGSSRSRPGPSARPSSSPSSGAEADGPKLIDRGRSVHRTAVRPTVHRCGSAACGRPRWMPSVAA